jgi:hypothetical protein
VVVAAIEARGTEDISWRCSRCTKMEAATHVHTSELAAYEEQISATANSCQSHPSFSTSLMQANRTKDGQPVNKLE